MSAGGGTLDAYGLTAQAAKCEAIRAIITEEFVRAHFTGGVHTAAPWAWTEALVLLRHLRPDRQAEVLFCHAALRAEVEAQFHQCGQVEPDLAALSCLLAEYLELCGLVRERGAWVDCDGDRRQLALAGGKC